MSVVPLSKPWGQSVEVDTGPAEVQALDIPAAATWADRGPPPPRDWIHQDLSIPSARVTLFTGNGGTGKTTIGMQLAVHVALSRPLWGSPVAGGRVLGVFCEDEQDEVERRVRSVCEGEGVDLADLDGLHLISRDGQENGLCVFDRDQIVLTDFYAQVDATVAALRPRLTILDTAADMFLGDFVSTPHVRQFIKVALGGLCARYGTAVLLLAHPSAAAMASGDGGGFSTAWNNSVRSRLYLRSPKTTDAEAAADRRVLETRKSNYGPNGGAVPLVYRSGRFVLDPDPIPEGKPEKAARTDTRLSLAVMAYFQQRAAAGQVVSFGAVFEALQSAGDIPRGAYETVRKTLQRALRQLTEEGLIKLSDVPRGYRIVREVAV